ncbi:hypothetical protein DFA_07580 [Cavenderia fasciculata]|uniref:Uncharacterized protein n=1 Tax=Cavenderia fasciculata TaxID=261658 RepID=F4PWU2_CACFS|nr:uncharacterized protein DFA_07580 [Cavenderia fasciculata]EGG20456.1 hypothetical protein DFA_07580 [Cavenderia fasciculata]|eukprot:XP_004367439.1 hypothetical protein DFA_07580 [Cavenderia fasciculata]
MTTLLQLSNLLLIHIISEIEDNVDTICLLMTCKKLYHNSGIRGSISFKGIGIIDTNKRNESKSFRATVKRFNLNSFKDTLDKIIVRLNSNRVKGILDDLVEDYHRY